MGENVFFQHGDEPDAANFAQSLGVAVKRSYTVKGLSFEFDKDDSGEKCQKLHVDRGVAVIVHDEMQTASPNIDPVETRRVVGHPVEMSTKTNLNLALDSINYVWLDANVRTSDSPKIQITQEYAPPTDYSLAIGRVDNEGEYNVVSDRVSDLWFRAIGDGSLSFPDRDVVDTVAEGIEDGTKVYVRDLGYSVEIDGSEFNDINTRGGTSRVVRESEEVTVEEDESLIVLDWFEARGDFTVKGDMLIMDTGQ